MLSTQINKLLKSTASFLGTFPRDKLPAIKKTPATLIINTDPSTEPGEHWVAVRFDKSAEYFDSYGLPPYYKEIAEFLERNSPDGKVVINHVTLQTPGLSVTCGHYCCLFVIFRSRGLEFEDMLAFFTRNTFLNDIVVRQVLGI